MKAGNLKYQIKILVNSGTTDSFGANNDNWLVYSEVRAGIFYRGGNKLIQDFEMFNSSNIDFTIRYDRYIHEQMRVKFFEKIYKINSINKNPFDNSLILSCELISGLSNSTPVLGTTGITMGEVFYFQGTSGTDGTSGVDGIDISDIIEVTVSELNNLITNSELKPNFIYLITDYQTIDYIRQTTAPTLFYEAPIEQIYLQASSVNTLYYNGYSKTFEGEQIGYLQTRPDHTESPSIYYYGDSQGDVTVAVTDSVTLEITDNPYPESPYLNDTFSLYIYDNDSGAAHEFNETDKGTNWEWDGNNFVILNQTYQKETWMDIDFDGTDNYGAQGVGYFDYLILQATTPMTSMVNWIYDTNGSYWQVEDYDSGAVGYYDACNKDMDWRITIDGEFKIINPGNPTYTDSYYTPGDGNQGSTELTIETATEISFLISGPLSKGTYYNGSAEFYIGWTDDTTTHLDIDNYGTSWTISSNMLTLLGNTHSLLNDVVYIEAYPIYLDESIQVSFDDSFYVYGSFYFMEDVDIDLTGDVELSGGYTYNVPLGGLIVNRNIPSASIDIDFDFRGTLFRRYKISTVPYDTGTIYTAGTVVDYNGIVYIKTWDEGTIRHPNNSQYYISWAYVCPSKDYYTTGKGSFSIYNFTIAPDLTQYVDTCFLQQYLTDFSSINLLNISGLNIKYDYETRTINGSPDIVFRGTSNINSNVTVTPQTCATVNTVNNVDVILDYRIILTGAFTNCKGKISDYVGYNLTNGEFALMQNTLWYNVDKIKIIGSVTYLICGGYDRSYGNVVSGSLNNSRVGLYITNNTINDFVGNTVNYYVKGNYINAMTDCVIGYYVKDNQIYSEAYGVTATQYMSTNRIYGQFGYSLTNPKQRAGKWHYLSGNDLYGYFYESTNNNLGGTTKYNDFYTMTNCIVRGNVNSNNMPYVNINECSILQGMSLVDKVNAGAVTDSIGYTKFFGGFHNIRFVGRTTLTYSNFYGNFQNGWFGGGTFDNPTDNMAVRNFTYTNAFGTFQQFNFISGYVDRNTWLGNTEAYGGTYTVFNMTGSVTVSDNIFGPSYKGNQHTKQMIGCTIGTNVGNNSFNQILNQTIIGNNFINNSFTTTLTSCEIGNGVANKTIPSIGYGVKYPKMIIQGVGITTDINFQTLNSGGTALITGLDNGKLGVGSTAPDKQVEINAVSGDCLRLTYNDSNGTATNYTDFSVSSSGDLTINASGGDVKTSNVIQTGGYISSGGNAGLSTTVEVMDSSSAVWYLQFENGLLVSVEEA